MARRHMGFVERHGEKLVFGMAGVVLTGVVLFCAVRSPNRIRVEGRALAPEEFYKLLAVRADHARQAIREAHLAELEELPQLASKAKVARGPFLAAGSPGPRIPRLDDLVELRNIKLATILAPTLPIASTGKAYAAVPKATEASILDARQPARLPSLVPGQDWHWVTLAAVISRHAQRQAFLAANYALGRLDFIVTDVEAERQEQTRNGTWRTAELIKPYQQLRLIGPRETQLHEDKFGYEVDPQDWGWIHAYRQQLGQREAQAAILRAPFQPFLAEQRPEDDDCFAWTVPATLPANDGTEITLCDAAYGLRFAVDESPGSAFLKGSAAALAQLKQAKEAMATGWETVGLQPYLEAAEDLRSIAADASVPNGLRQAAARVLEPNQGEIAYATQLRRAEQARQEMAVDTGLGPPVEPMWITDTTVEPGKTYRYRIRLFALNPYAGAPTYLANPHDASRLILEGQWSPWSKPIRVKPIHHLFLIGPDDEAQKTVRVQLYQWSRGTWENGSTTVGIGNTLVIERHTSRLTYDGVVHKIDFHHPYVEDRAREQDSRRTAASETVALTLAKSDGSLEEHFAARDKLLRRDLLSDIRNEEKRRRTRQGHGQGWSQGLRADLQKRSPGTRTQPGLGKTSSSNAG